MPFLFNLFIKPIELIVQLVFVWAYRVFENPGAAILWISIVINFLILPLYNRADALQEAERTRQEKMARWVEHIKKAFRGDERYMMLSAYYLENGYKPVYALRSSISLLLQIPFFIAAYHYLSGCELLKKSSFWFITDLGSPDKLLQFGTVSVNLLPFVMTLINIVSGIVYMKGTQGRLKDKLQLFILAAVFLVLLYGSPAGLVLYWTMNNVFSLVKNLFQKGLKPEGIKKNIILAILLFIMFIIPFVLGNMSEIREVFFLLCITVLLEGIVLLPILPLKRIPWLNKLFLPGKREGDTVEFILGMLFLTVLSGLLIPSSVVSSSPFEFVNLNNFVNPLQYVFTTFTIYAGFFLIWFPVIYYMSPKEYRNTINAIIWTGSAMSIVNFMFFGRSLGIMNSDLKFETRPSFSMAEKLLNTLCMLVIIVAFLWLFYKKEALIRPVYLILLTSVCVLSVKNMITTNRILDDRNGNLAELGDEDDRILSFSKEGKNVIVFMLDRAIGTYVPYIFDEKPELLEQFDGFEYYPNTVSFGHFTNFGTPALFGGYEYSADMMNKRSDQSLEEKQNEALKLMPVLFQENGYEITVCDPPYAGYDWTPDLSIFDEYPEMHTYLTMGHFFVESTDRDRDDFFWGYSIFKTAPVVLQRLFYDDGFYYTAPVKLLDLSDFTKSYNILSHLPYMTKLKEDGGDTFLMIDNDLTHEPVLLSLPDYTPSQYASLPHYPEDAYVHDGRVMRMESEYQIKHYQTNVAAFIQLGKWFDYLKELGVYDNTRIILVSDHGRMLGQFDDLVMNQDLDVQGVNPLLLVKDFNSRGYKISGDFMTNGDVPTLAMKDLIEDPVNPFTGNPVTDSEKYAHDQLVTLSWHLDIGQNNGNVFDTSDAPWYSVHDDIFNPDNWKEYPYE